MLRSFYLSFIVVSAAAAALAIGAQAQQPGQPGADGGSHDQPRVFYFPKPVKRTPYEPPMKPLIRLADLKAKHRGEKSWRELVISDNNTSAYVIQAPPGSKQGRLLYADSPAWWVVIEGRIRFEIEKPDRSFETFEARKGSYVFAPERMLHSLEVVGSAPAVRFEVTVVGATPVFPRPPEAPKKGEEYIAVTVRPGPNPLDVPDPNGKPRPSHVNVYDLAEQRKPSKRWSLHTLKKNRAGSTLICGFASEEPEAEPGYRGHFHADFAEFWVVMLGELRWIFEGDAGNAVIAEEGDIVYAPPKTFHLPQFYGEEGLNCRLASNAYPASNHLFDAPH